MGNLTREHLAELTQPLSDKLIRRLPANAGKAKADKAYLGIVEHIHVANLLFGFDFATEIQEPPRLAFEHQLADGKWEACYLCHMRVTACGVVHDGIGCAANVSSNRGEAHVNAAVSCQSDAFKSATVYFGDRFGLSLKLKEEFDEDILGAGYSAAAQRQLVPAAAPPPLPAPVAPANTDRQPTPAPASRPEPRTTDELATDHPTAATRSGAAQMAAQPAALPPSTGQQAIEAEEQLMRAEINAAAKAYWQATGRPPQTLASDGITGPKGLDRVASARLPGLLAGVRQELAALQQQAA